MKSRMYTLWSASVSVGVFFLIYLMFTSCEVEDKYEEQFDEVNKWAIIGPDEVMAGADEQTYYTRYEEDVAYTWTVSGASITKNRGYFIEVEFGAAEATISVSAPGKENNTKTVTVNTATPTVTATYQGGGPLKEGARDTIDIEFSIDVDRASVVITDELRSTVMGATAPTVTTDYSGSDLIERRFMTVINPMTGGESEEEVETGGEVSKTHYSLAITAPAGDGKIFFYIEDAEATAELGGKTMEQDSTADLTIDNTVPTLIDQGFSASVVAVIRADTVHSQQVVVRLQMSEALKQVAVELDDDDEPDADQMPPATPKLTIESTSFNNIENETTDLTFENSGATVVYTFTPMTGTGDDKISYRLPSGATGTALDFTFTVKLTAEDAVGNPLDAAFSEDATLRGIPATND